ncbi:class I adenylate-forming enzyme family protein [Pseudonocardia xishanensis]|uniref:Class I adenylate-forming enzyme family protein n=2 Tax=Pseudonocardia xishanensis TaxID=630995 RepID=A0ABP8RWI8_9PSEU
MEWPDQCSIGDVLTRAARAHPDRGALAIDGEHLTYAELDAAAHLLAEGLHSLGVRRGDHVGIFMPNSVEFVETLFAVALLGAVVVPINTRYRGAELCHVLKSSDLKAVATTERPDVGVSFPSLLAAALPHALEDSVPGPGRGATPVVVLRGLVPAGWVGRSDLVDATAHAPRATMVTPEPGELAMIIHTSGTTSMPKGCMLTHEAVVRAAIERTRTRFPGTADEVFWIPGPFFHILALTATLGCFSLGGRVVSGCRYVTPATDLLGRERVTSAWPGFPGLVRDLLDDPEFQRDRLPHLRSIFTIGPESLLLDLQERLPAVALLNGCGMTETAGPYSFTARDDSRVDRARSGGTPLPGMETRIVDASGAPLPPGESGEIQVRGYSVMTGYYRAPEHTAAAFTADGWLRTGDMGVQTATGHLAFRDRAKDMLKVGGENVAASEVESALLRHEAVKLAEVIGRPDRRLDEVPVAFVELHPGRSVGETDLIEFCREVLARFKVPRQILFLAADAWPTSATKVDKSALRQMLSDAEPARN